MKTTRILTIALFVGLLGALAACSGAEGIDGVGDIVVPDDVVTVDEVPTDDTTLNADESPDVGEDYVRIVKTASVKNCTVGKPCSREFAAVGAEEIAWTIEGTLPDGITFAPKAGSKTKELMSGTPTADGDFPVTLVAKDASDETDSDHFDITIRVTAATSGSGDGNTTPDPKKPMVAHLADRLGAMADIRKLLPGSNSSGELTLEAISMRGINVIDGPFQVQHEPFILKASGGKAPYTWSADKDGNSAGWIIGNIAKKADCSAEGSASCSMVVAGVSPRLTDPSQNPVTEIAFTVTDADGKTATQKGLLTATYPDANDAGYNVTFSNEQPKESVIRMNNHVEFFFYQELSQDPAANIIASVDIPGDPNDKHADPASFSLPITLGAGYDEGFISKIKAITVRVTPSRTTDGCYTHPSAAWTTWQKMQEGRRKMAQQSGSANYISMPFPPGAPLHAPEIVAAGTKFENEYWTWELVSDVTVECDENGSPRGTVVAESSEPLLTRKAPSWFATE